MTLTDNEKDGLAQKLQWIKTLKVGDVVCNCKYKHLKIAELEEEWYPKPKYQKLIIKLVYHNMVPFSVGTFLHDKLFWLCDMFGAIELWDKQLTLEDGSYCSALNCCNPPDHIHD